MSHACPHFEPLILDRAGGALAPGDAARLDRHLAGCAPCREQAEAVALALSLAALPPPSDRERVAVAEGARSALRHDGRLRSRRRFGGGIAIALAASVALFLAVKDRGPADPGWTPPDLDAVWAATAASDPDATEEPAEVLFAELQEVDLDAD
ncbi:MAG: zf-HC2 domain-containing protein [Deltaproteobacteria bacterium]